MENTNVQEVKMPITYDDLKKSLVDSGRPYDFAMIDRAYALAEKAHGEQRRRADEGRHLGAPPLAGERRRPLGAEQPGRPGHEGGEQYQGPLQFHSYSSPCQVASRRM